MPRFLRGLFLAGALVLAGCGMGAGDSREAIEQPKVTKAQGKQDDGSRLGGVSSFQVPGVGDEAEGLLATSTLERRKLDLTAVAFRRARIIGIALVARADKHDVQGEARALAVKLDKRIQGVLAAEIQVEPEREAPGTNAKATGSFQGRERLPALTVARADVAGGAR